MKKMILAAMLSTTAWAQQTPATIPSGPVTQHAPAGSKAKKLTRGEFEALLTHPEQLLLIDVRRPDEISTIGGFPVYLNIQIADLQNHFSEIPKNRVIVTVSNHAARAGVAADLLASHGFNVAGAVGVQTYQADGGAIQKFPVPQHIPVAQGQQ